MGFFLFLRNKLLQCPGLRPKNKKISFKVLPSNSKLPSVRSASVMLPTSLASGMLVRLGEASWWARPFGMPGWRSGLCINTRDSIFSRPSWMSFFSCGIWRLRSYNTAVSAGLDKHKHTHMKKTGWTQHHHHTLKMRTHKYELYYSIFIYNSKYNLESQIQSVDLTLK